MENRKLVDIKSPSVQCGRTEGKGYNNFAACVNVLFIHLRSIIGLGRENFALPLSLAYGGMSIAGIQNILSNPNSTKLLRT